MAGRIVGPAGVLVVGLVGAVLASALAAASPSGAAPGDARRPVIVVLTDLALTDGDGAAGAAAPSTPHSSDERGEAVARVAGIPESVIGHRYDILPGFSARLTDVEVERLQTDPRVATVVADELRRPLLDDIVALVGADQLHTLGVDGAGWTVAVLDTGFDLSHPFLDGSTSAGIDGLGSVEACFARGADFDDGVGDCPGATMSATGVGASAPCAPATAGCGHGTSVAGIALGADGVNAAVTFDGLAPGAELLPVRVFSEFSGTNCNPGPSPCALAWDSDVIAGLDHVFAQRVHYDIASVNLSLGSGQFGSYCDAFSSYTAAIDQLSDVGIAVTVATGNAGHTTGIAMPSCVESAIAVTASTDIDTIAGFANADDIVDLAAPGVSLRTSVVGGGYTSAFSGTSAAAPVVAGAYAVLRQAFPTAPLDLLTAAMKASPATVVDGPNVFPRVQVDHAYAQLAALAPPTAVTATAGVDALTIAWTWAPDPDTAAAPASPAGFRITDQQTGESVEIDGTERSAVLTDLPSGTRTFTVAAITGAGVGQATATAPTNVAGVPGPVTALTASPARAGVTVSWSPPVDDGGAGITGYRVTSAAGTTTVDTTTTTVTGLAVATLQEVTVAAVNPVGVGPSASAQATTLSATAGTFTPLPPTRLLDTRFTGAPKPGPDTTLTLPVAGTHGVPDDATAVVVNLTGVDATDDGFVTAHPSNTPRPTASNLNLARDDIRPNLAIVPVGPDGAIDLYTQSGTHLVVDLAGFWRTGELPATSGRYVSAGTPTRLLDTRFTGAPKPGPDTTLTLPVAGTHGVPDDATAVVVNLTGVEATDDGFVTAHPSNTPRPTASNLNLARDDIRPNLAIVPVGPDGAIDLYTQSGTHLVVDLAGWFTGESEPAGTSGLFTAVTPVRTLDTRFTGAPKPVAGETVDARVAGAGGVPPSVAAVALNLTGVEATDDGFVTAHPSNTPRPTASNLNLGRGQTLPNAAIVATGSGGSGSSATVRLYTDRGAHLITDVAGWFNE